MTTENKNGWLNTAVKVVAFVVSLITIGAVFYSLSVAYNKVGVVDQRLDKKIKVINDQADCIHKLQVEEAIQNEQIKQLQDEIKELKTKR